MHIKRTQLYSYSILSVQHISAVRAILREFLHEVLNLAKIWQITFVIGLLVCVCVYIYIYIHTHTHTHIYRVSQEEGTKIRESVPYVTLYRYNPKHLYPKLNGYGDNGQKKV